MADSQRQKVSTTVYLNKSQSERLKAVSQATGIPQAVLIRDALDRHLESAIKKRIEHGHCFQ